SLELGLPSAVSLMAGAIFAVHPVHTEAVSWIAGVGDLSCAIFYSSGLVAFLRYLRDRKVKWLWAASICFLGGLFSKETAVTFPLVCFLLIYKIPKKQRPNFKATALMLAPFIPVIGVYAAFRIAAVGWTAPTAVHDAASIFDWTTLGIWVL